MINSGKGFARKGGYGKKTIKLGEGYCDGLGATF